MKKVFRVEVLVEVLGEEVSALSVGTQYRMVLAAVSNSQFFEFESFYSAIKKFKEIESDWVNVRRIELDEEGNMMIQGLVPIIERDKHGERFILGYNIGKLYLMHSSPKPYDY